MALKQRQKADEMMTLNDVKMGEIPTGTLPSPHKKTWNNHIWNPDHGHTYPPKRSSTMFNNMNVSKFIFVGFASRILAKGTNFKTRLMTDVVVWSQELSWIVNIKLLYYCIFLNIICINKTVNRKQLCNIHCEENPNIRYTLQVLHVL